MLQSILNVLKSRYFWVGVGFVLLVTLALIVGSWAGWSLVTRLSIVIGLMVVFMGIFLVEFVRARRNAQKIEQSITMQSEDQSDGISPEKQAEIDELRDRLEDAIGKLKNTKIGQGRSQNALHVLPWYMFIGPPGAGKTTTIKNSGLNFPMETDSVQGVGGTRNCDWFFSDQAILLDTAGRYMTEKEDEVEWHSFLDMLKERRKNRPINGVIVGISLEELVDAAPDEIEWHADNIRRRVSELVERLEVRFPIYLVFTKCDLLQGFVEFFEDKPRAEREQIWGATLTEEQRENSSSPRKIFEEEFDLLYEGLIGERSDRLSRSLNPEERRRVYAFPLEFAAAKENLSLFVDQLFQENPYQESPEFRGFYFTSGTQEGTPIDRVLQSMSDDLDVASEVSAGSESQSGTKSYFIKDLFTEAIIPDQYRVEQTTSSVRRHRLVRWGVGAASALLLALFTIFAGQAVVRSEVSLGKVESASREAATVSWDNGKASVNNLEQLDRLRSEIARLERNKEDPPTFQWGFYRGEQVLEPARDLFAQKVEPLARAQFTKIENRLLDAKESVSGSLDQDQRLKLRETLRAYLLLSEEAQRLSDEQERVFLKQYLTTVATQDTGRVVTAAFQNRSGQVEAQIGRFVEQMSKQKINAFEARSTLVGDIRQMIYRKPTIGNLYASIKQQGLNSLEPVRLASILQESGGATLFDKQPEISGFFTKKGWNSYVKEQIEQAAEDPGKGSWVLGGQDSKSSFSLDNLQNEKELGEQLRQRYFEDYATAWKQFLRKVEYRSFGGVSETSRALNKLGDPFNSPLVELLARVSTETNFASTMADKAKDVVSEEVETRAKTKARQKTRSDVGTGGGSDEAKSLHPVTRRFVGVHRLKPEKAANGEASPNLTRSIKAMGRIGGLLDQIANSPGKAKDIAKQVLDGSGDLQATLSTMRNDLTRIDSGTRRALFDATVLSAWETILGAAKRQLNKRWRRNVYRTYQANLEGRYPFEESTEDASIADVESFFRPREGAVASFRKQHLSPFMKEGQLRTRTWEGRGLRLSPKTRRFLSTADRIAENLFSGGSLRLQFQMIPELPKKSEEAPAASQVVLRIHGTPQRYRMGHQPTTTFMWPDKRGAKVVMRTRGGTLPPKEKPGGWAWFRLLEEATVEPVGQNKYRIRWVFEKADRYSIVARYNLRAEADQQLFTDPRGFFRTVVPESL